MDFQCSICLEDIFNRDTCLTQCNHRYCIDCLNIWFDRGEHSCPMCRQAIQYITHNNEIKRIIFNRINGNIQRVRNNLIPRSMINGNVIMSRSLYLFMIGSYFFMTTFILLPSILYYETNQDYINISNELIECRHEY